MYEISSGVIQRQCYLATGRPSRAPIKGILTEGGEVRALRMRKTKKGKKTRRQGANYTWTLKGAVLHQNIDFDRIFLTGECLCVIHISECKYFKHDKKKMHPWLSVVTVTTTGTVHAQVQFLFISLFNYF